MNFPATIKTSITPQKAQQVLQEHGLQVTLEQSKEILEFLIKLAQSTQYAKDSRPIHQGKYRRAS